MFFYIKETFLETSELTFTWWHLLPLTFVILNLKQPWILKCSLVWDSATTTLRNKYIKINKVRKVQRKPMLDKYALAFRLKGWGTTLESCIVTSVERLPYLGSNMKLSWSALSLSALYSCVLSSTRCSRFREYSCRRRIKVSM